MKVQAISCDVCKDAIRPGFPRFESVEIHLVHVNGDQRATAVTLEDVCSVGCLHKGVDGAVQEVTKQEVRQTLAEFDEWLLLHAPR